VNETDLTIEQLAALTGLTVRNIRSHRTAGLMPPPEVRGSTGYYGQEHVARLKLIQELQAEGFNLQAIKRLIDATHAPQSMLGFRHVLFAPLHEQPSSITTLEELRAELGEQGTDAALEKAVELGELVPLDGGRLEVTNPALLEAVKDIASRGIGIEAGIAATDIVRSHCHAIATAFVDVFVEEVWKPFEDAGYPAERWPEITESIERLRPLASRVLITIFQTELTNAIERRVGQEVRRLTGGADQATTGGDSGERR
jgi:DNA-binding transcriptional MerR regulator